MAASRYPDLVDFIAVRIDDMDRAGEARVEGMRHSQNLKRTFWILHGGPDQGLLDRALNAFAVARRDVPARRGDDLVVGKTAPFDPIPMCQRPARCLPEPYALRTLRHGVIGEGRFLAGLDVVKDLLRPSDGRIRDHLGLQRPRGNPADD